MQVGNTIKLGPYDWKVLKVDALKTLLITDTIIKQMPYHHKHEPVTWETSSLRKYLNNDFLCEFSYDDRTRIVKTNHQNKTNAWYPHEIENNTDDFIFILSLEEMAGPYFNDSMHILENRTPSQKYWFNKKDINNHLRQSTYKGHIWWYWARTVGRVNTSAVYIHGDGNIGIQGNKASKKSFNTIHPITHANEGGIRPAVWIKNDSLTTK